MAIIDRAFQPIEKLIGTWKANGRTLDSNEDNVFGEVSIQPILNGKYIELRSQITFKNYVFDSIEIIYYDPITERFPSAAFVGMGDGPGVLTSYEWYTEDTKIIHRGAGAVYHGTFSKDNNLLSGGWRPDTSEDDRDEASYNLTMTRII